MMIHNVVLTGGTNEDAANEHTLYLSKRRLISPWQIYLNARFCEIVKNNNDLSCANTHPIRFLNRNRTTQQKPSLSVDVNLYIKIQWMHITNKVRSF